MDNDNAKLAAEMFDHFCGVTTMRQIMGLHRNMLDAVGLRPGPLNDFYPKLKAKIRNWKAQALWKKFDARAAHRVYNKGTACSGIRVLVIGAGPCGLRTAIEAQLLGAKVVVVEKRDRISRNNVLHLWPFVITDLRNLGAKKFYGKFCAGSIDHISIRQLQCILLKVALLLGVEVHEGVSFVNLIEPKDGCGWRAQVSPEDHAVSHYEFDALIGADGKRNTLEGFVRKEFRGKLAIAITANFINKRTEAEAKVEEISGVAFIFNQSFFKELYYRTGIDLENIVYYKDETHYFVMTAKKMSLIDKGVIIQDSADPAELLSPSNVNTDKLLDYAREAAEFSTKYQMPNLEFAVNHYGKPDVAMFDFTSMFQAENSSRISVRKNYRLLQCLVGDSLLEPFWPTGSGCARGFLSSMDAAYAIKLFANPRNSCLAVLAQRESLYRLLGQTTPENLNRDIMAYTLDPSTRYPNLNKTLVQVQQVEMLLDADDTAIYQQTFMDTNAISTVPDAPVRRKRRTGDTTPLGMVLLRWIKSQLKAYEFSNNLTDVAQCFTHGKVLCALIHRYRPDLVDFASLGDIPAEQCNAKAFDILENDLGIPRVMQPSDSVNIDQIESKTWLNYLEQICELFRGEIPHVKHPKLDFAELKEKQRSNIPDFSNLVKSSGKRNVVEAEAINRRIALDEERNKNRSRRLNYEQMQAVQASEGPRRAKKRRSHEKFQNVDRERGFYSALPRGAPDEKFSNRIKSMESKIVGKNMGIGDKKPKDLLRAIGKIESDDWNVREIEKKIEQSKKAEVGKSREKVPKWSREQFLARQSKMSKPVDRQSSIDEKFKEIDMTIKSLDKQLKEGHNLDRGERGKNKVASIAGQFGKKTDEGGGGPSGEEKSGSKSLMNSKLGLVLTSQGVSEICHFCKQKVYLMEKISAEGLVLHRSCLKCHHCHTNLRLGGYAFDRDSPDGLFYCNQHFKLPPKPYKPVTKRQPHFPKHEEISAKTSRISPDKASRAENIVAMDLLDRGQTPERIEFENTDAMSDGERSLNNIIDENEWTDRNFGTGTDETDSDLTSSDSSDSETDSDMYEEAMDSPLGAETLQLATDWIGKQRICSLQDSDGDEFYDSSEDDDVDTQTEGEELARAREIRMQEVKLMPPVYPATDTETEVVSKGDEISSAKNDRAEILWGCRGDFQVPESISQLNEKLYNLNHFLNLNKDINAMKRDNFVRDDMKKKQSLKEQWLSNVPVAEDTSDHFARYRSNSRDSSLSKSSSVLASNVANEFGSALEIRETDEISGDEIFKDCTPEEEIQLDNLALGEAKAEIEKARTSDDLLTFEEEEALLKEMSQNKLKLLKTLRDIDSKNFKDTLSAITCQTSMPKVSAQSSVDLSKYFPENKKTTSQSQNVNKNQKELKDVDLSKYFAQNNPSTSKGASSMLPISNPTDQLGTNKTQLEVNKSQNSEKKPSDNQLGQTDDALCESDFNMFDQLLDGAIDLKMFMAHIERIEPQKGKITQCKAPQKIQNSTERTSKMTKKQEDDNISVTFEDIFDFDNDNTDIDMLLSDRELDQNDDIDGKIFDEILYTVPGEKVNVNVMRKKRIKKSSFRDRAINSAQGNNRGIETKLLPPKPKVIRETPRVPNKKVKSAPKKEEIASGLGNKGATKNSTAKKVVNKNEKEIPNKTVEKTAKVVAKDSVNPNAKIEITKMPDKPVQIHVKMTEKKENPPKDKINYVADPKMSKYFFNDISIVEDIPEISNKTPTKITTPLADFDESKILAEFEEILQDIALEEVEEMPQYRVENIKIIDHVQEICDKIDKIEIVDTISHSLGDTLSHVLQDQIKNNKIDLDQFDKEEIDKNDVTARSRERSQGKLSDIVDNLSLSRESQGILSQVLQEQIKNHNIDLDRFIEETDEKLSGKNKVVEREKQRSRERSEGKVLMTCDKINQNEIGSQTIPCVSQGKIEKLGNDVCHQNQSTINDLKSEENKQQLLERSQGIMSITSDKRNPKAIDDQPTPLQILQDKVEIREKAMDSTLESISENVEKISERKERSQGQGSILTDKISPIKIDDLTSISHVVQDQAIKDHTNKAADQPLKPISDTGKIREKKQRSRDRSQGKVSITSTKTNPKEIDDNTPESVSEGKYVKEITERKQRSSDKISPIEIDDRTAVSKVLQIKAVEDHKNDPTEKQLKSIPEDIRTSRERKLRSRDRSQGKVAIISDKVNPKEIDDNKPESVSGKYVKEITERKQRSQERSQGQRSISSDKVSPIEIDDRTAVSQVSQIKAVEDHKKLRSRDRSQGKMSITSDKVNPKEIDNTKSEFISEDAKKINERKERSRERSQGLGSVSTDKISPVKIHDLSPVSHVLQDKTVKDLIIETGDHPPKSSERKQRSRDRSQGKVSITSNKVNPKEIDNNKPEFISEDTKKINEKKERCSERSEGQGSSLFDTIDDQCPLSHVLQEKLEVSGNVNEQPRAISGDIEKSHARKQRSRERSRGNASSTSANINPKDTDDRRPLSHVLQDQVVHPKKLMDFNPESTSESVEKSYEKKQQSQERSQEKVSVSSDKINQNESDIQQTLSHVLRDKPKEDSSDINQQLKSISDHKIVSDEEKQRLKERSQGKVSSQVDKINPVEIADHVSHSHAKSIALSQSAEAFNSDKVITEDCAKEIADVRSVKSENVDSGQISIDQSNSDVKFEKDLEVFEKRSQAVHSDRDQSSRKNRYEVIEISNEDDKSLEIDATKDDQTLARSSVSPTKLPKPRDQPYIRDYDNDTHKLLRRSRDLHNKKQEFMNDRITGNNPYLKRMRNRGNFEERTNLTGTDRYYNYPSSSILSSPSTRLPTISYTSNYSVLDSIRRTPKAPPRTYSNRDACSIS
ncbi:F-actin-monooxygenase Mical isoform X2 [Phlebotomus papatasi]|uniref:F-actin-monooxygenase Mical isoform X2 n=1 Tax=Phlebotomus papatasi TaxID=29031 RepID=UPI0024844280|nr:F-actin-monooxygenase Mical isoform X2 [Phlebotomus papatasi]